ncbi:MAG: hypothetical protein HOW73_21320 [Polyangiaceae bacterium]|nr:hypothetical protein [Polyangiaceae bacterium]
MNRLLCLLVGSLFVVGCGSSSEPDDGGAGGTGSGGEPASGGNGQGGGEGGTPNNNPSFTVTFDPITVAPGEENTQCVVKKLGNDAAIKVNEIHNVLPQGSHHLIVYRTADTEEKLEPYDCQPFADTLDPTKGSPLMVTQKHDETLTLPSGVAFSLDANVMVRLEMHYINPTTEPLDIGATSTFYTMPEADFENEADFLFLGNPDISIPPNQSFTLGPTFLKLPADLEGSNIFGITGHTHQFGTNVTVALAPTEAEGSDTMVYDVDGWKWDEPATVYLDPPTVLPQGGGFRFTCDWNNTSAETVGFGESANDEMCFFWAYYYPSKGAKVCAHTDQVPGGFDLCCPGNDLCNQIFN